MKNLSMDHLIDNMVSKYGEKLLEENISDEITSQVMCAFKDSVKEKLKLKVPKTIYDLASLLNDNSYGHELDNPYALNIESLCEKNKWIVLFPHSDDLLEIRGHIYDELDAWDGVKAVIYKKGEFYCDNFYDDTYKKAYADMICPVSDSAYNDEVSKDKFGVNVEFEPKEDNYVWTITASTCKNVAYFNIERDDTDKHWARCCVIDCSEL